MGNIKHSECREFYHWVIPDLIQVCGVEELRVRNTSDNLWEAQGPGNFYWQGLACCEWNALTQAARNLYRHLALIDAP